MTREPWWREPTRAQWCAFGAAWAGWVLDAFDFTIFMLVMPRHRAASSASRSLATAGSITLTLFARLVGGYIAGAAADRWGRKLPLMISILWFAVCDGAVALAPSFGWILVLRTLFGLGMGAEWTTGTTLAMENWPTRSRGIASGVLQGSWAVGLPARGRRLGRRAPALGLARALRVRGAAGAPRLPDPLLDHGEPRVEGGREPRGAWRRSRWRRARSASSPGRRSRWASASAPTTRSRGSTPRCSSRASRRHGHGRVARRPLQRGHARRLGRVRSARRAQGAWHRHRASRRSLSLFALPLYVGAVPGDARRRRVPRRRARRGLLRRRRRCSSPACSRPTSRARFVGIVYHVGAALAALVPTATAAFAEPTRTSACRSPSASSPAPARSRLAIVVLSGRRFPRRPRPPHRFRRPRRAGLRRTPTLVP